MDLIPSPDHAAAKDAAGATIAASSPLKKSKAKPGGNAMSMRSGQAPARPINWTLTVIVFFAGSVLLWADRTNFSVAAAAWAKEYGWTPSVIGMMLSAFSLGYLILQPIGGWIPDKIGRRPQ